jgi:preprotein translocase SecE subunit
VARDRKRSRQRRRSKPVREPAANRVARADLPGSLDHAGEVDEFDAALLRGAGGVPATGETADELAAESAGEATGAPVETAPARRSPAAGNGTASAAAVGAAVAERKPSQPIGARVSGFLRASWAELQRVQWPDRRAVTQATAVVLGFVAVMGAYLGLADWAAQKIVNFIL